MAGRRNTMTNEWRLGKEVPLSLIFGLFVQTGAFVWWMAALSATVNLTAAQSIKTDVRIAAIETQINQFTTTVTAPAAVSAQKVTSLESEVREIRLRLDTVQLEQARVGAVKDRK